jgi:hypothetical protein
MLAPIYGPFGIEYYIIFSPLVVFESVAQKNLFCLNPRVKCYRESMGVNCFWHVKDVFLKVGITLTSPFMEWDAWI